MSIHYLDIALLIAAAWFLFKGIKNGLVKEITFLLVLILGIYATYNYSFIMLSFLRKNLEWGKDLSLILSFLLTFLATAFVIYFIGAFLTKIINFIALGWLNSLLGGVFGLTKMIIVASIVFALFDKINHDDTFYDQESLEESMGYRTVSYVNTDIFPLKKLLDIKYLEEKLQVLDIEKPKKAIKKPV